MTATDSDGRDDGTGEAEEGVGSRGTGAVDQAAGSASDRDRPVRLADGAELDALLAEEELVLVDFYTKGCTLCQAVEPVLGSVARASDVTVALLNPREDLDLVDAYDVRSVPTLVLFRDGTEVDRLADGFVGAERVLETIRDHDPDAAPDPGAE